MKDLEYKVEKLRKDKGSFEEKVKVAKVIVCLRFLCNCINQAKVIVLGGSFEAHYTKVVQGGEIISDVDEDDNGDDVEEEKEINYDGDDDDEKEKVVDVNANVTMFDEVPTKQVHPKKVSVANHQVNHVKFEMIEVEKVWLVIPLVGRRMPLRW